MRVVSCGSEVAASVAFPRNALDGVRTQAKLADYCSKTTFKTVAGDIKFNDEGEWTESQVMAVQFQGVSGNGVEQFRDPAREVILWPTKYKTGKAIYPYDPRK
jgi:branched-chain amino acid transport system substrate-binding protein